MIKQLISLVLYSSEMLLLYFMLSSRQVVSLNPLDLSLLESVFLIATDLIYFSLLGLLRLYCLSSGQISRVYASLERDSHFFRFRSLSRGCSVFLLVLRFS